MSTIAPPRKAERQRPKGHSTAAPALQTSPALPSKSKKQSEKEAILASYHPSRLTWNNVDWLSFIWIVGVHIGALAAPFFFTWEALGLTIFLHWLTLSIGIGLGYHRFLSHKSMRLRAPLEFFATLCGVLSGQGTPLAWAATHRLHHQQSDQEGDPHSPTDGPWWSHLWWMFVNRDQKTQDALYRRYVPELKDRLLFRIFERHYGLWLIGSGVVLFALGGLPWLLWGLCVRMVWSYHSTWFVNSATHIWGYRNYETRDLSRNLWWVAIFTYGEGWHNNHHAHPSNARAGHRWWEFDPTFWLIKLLKATGLAYEVKDTIPAKA